MEFSFDVEGNDVVDEALNKSDNGVKLMTMMINMKKTMMLITSMIMSPASLTLSLPDPQEPCISVVLTEMIQAKIFKEVRWSPNL